MPNLDTEYRDKTSPVWDMSQEPALLETLVSQRLHIFLIFSSILVAAALNAKLQIHLQITLTFGALLSWWIALAFSRVLSRLDQALLILSEDKSHPFSIVNAALNKPEQGRAWALVFFWITCIGISAASLLSWAGYLKVA